MSDVISKATSDANSAMQPSRYHLALVALHWLSAILILVALMTGAFWLKETPNSSPDKIMLLRGLSILGITILALILAQYAVRVLAPRPLPATTQHPVFDRIAAITHRGLYMVIIAMAVSGIVTAALAELLPILFGDSGVALPETFDEPAPRITHGVFAKIITGLVLLHVLGALCHHVFAKTVYCGACGSAGVRSQTCPNKRTNHEEG